MAEWTFLTNHAVVLSLIAKNPDITALELSTIIGITERSVRRIIADLSAESYISKKRVGRGVRYCIRPGLALRREAHREIAIGDLLEALSSKKD